MTVARVQPAPITTSSAVDGNWVVSDGLKAGDVVITEGLIGLKPGAKVTPVFEESKTPAVAPEPDTGE
jgi:membrane fusion protein (multidrug efflux system)